MDKNAITAQFELQTSWFLNALDGISEQETNTAFLENLNPIKWVAGHLTDARMTIHGIVSGSAVNTGYNKLFGKGTDNKMDSSYPTIEQIKIEWGSISEKLKTALQNLSDEKMIAQPPFQTSIPDGTLLGLIAYFSIHESFHIGQLSVYRKLAGKPPMNMGRR